MTLEELGVLAGQLGGISVVEIFCLVELSVTGPGGIGTQQLDAADRSVIHVKGVGEVIRMGAVDAEVEGRAAGGSSTSAMASWRGWPLGRRPSVSTVKAVTTGIRAAAAARTTPIASPVWVAVSMVTRSAPAATKESIWVPW